MIIAFVILIVGIQIILIIICYIFRQKIFRKMKEISEEVDEL